LPAESKPSPEPEPEVEVKTQYETALLVKYPFTESQIKRTEIIVKLLAAAKAMPVGSSHPAFIIAELKYLVSKAESDFPAMSVDEPPDPRGLTDPTPYPYHLLRTYQLHESAYSSLRAILKYEQSFPIPRASYALASIRQVLVWHTQQLSPSRS